MAQMGRVGTLHETLSLLLEEKTKRMQNYTKGIVKIMHCIVRRKDQILIRGLRSLTLFTSKIQTKKEAITI